MEPAINIQTPVMSFGEIAHTEIIEDDNLQPTSQGTLCYTIPIKC